MNEKDKLSPISAACIRNLSDKVYEKRKSAALEIQNLVKSYAATKQDECINKIIQILSNDLVFSHSPNSRKGGVLGLAATGIGLEKKISTYISDLVRPVLTCFYDPDNCVRYYACEALYNIVKVARTSILDCFDEVFDGLSKLASDVDQGVRNGSEPLDRLLKDIVVDDYSKVSPSIVQLLRDRIYTKNPYARQFIVSWVAVLDSVPDIDMISHLPKLLDGLFLILDDENQEVRKSCQTLLDEFLAEIVASISDDFESKIDVPSVFNILIIHCKSNDEWIQDIALSWIKEFVQQSGPAIFPFLPGLLTAILPCLSSTIDGRDAASFTAIPSLKRNISQTAESINRSLMNLIPSLIRAGDETSVALEIGYDSSKTIGDSNSTSGMEKASDTMIKSVTLSEQEAMFKHLDIRNLIYVLISHLQHPSLQTRMAVLNWLSQLFAKIPNKVYSHIEELFPVLLKTLVDPSEEVVLLDLKVLAEISKSLPAYFDRFMQGLVELFRADPQFLNNRAQLIITRLCVCTEPHDIYLAMATILSDLSRNGEWEEVEFVSRMVECLNSILLTAAQLYSLRNELKNLETRRSCELFECLYKLWCHAPVATLSLCLLTQNYKHSFDLLKSFVDIPISFEFLAEVDKLIQLLESPVFMFLRLHLLDARQNLDLIKTLYGLLMLLPQSQAFHTLNNRLKCLPIQQNSLLSAPANLANGENYEPTFGGPKERLFVEKISFPQLLKHFVDIQSQHARDLIRSGMNQSQNVSPKST